MVATIVHAATGSVKLAQRQLRHASSSITSDVYIHPDDEETRRAGQALADAIVPKLAHQFAHQSGSKKEWVN